MSTHPDVTPRKVPAAPLRYNGLLVALAVTLAGCEDSTVGDVVVRIELAPAHDTLTVGEVKVPFTATAFNARDDEVPGADITWRSDQPFIAAVDSFTGVVTALATGVAAVTARSGAVADTAEVFVVGPLALPLDTLLLFPGDTLTIPVHVRATETAEATVVFGGGDSTVAVVNAATGLVTAIDFGVADFTARVDTFTVTGQVQVLDVPDTTLGNVYLGLSGAANARFRMASRAFNHPTRDGRTALQLVAESFDGSRRIVLELIDSLAGARLDTVGELTASALGTGNDPVCFPPVNWAVYDDFDNLRKARSLSGVVSFTTVRDIEGGKAVSGRFDIRQEFLDAPGPDGQLTAMGTLLVPVVALAACPQEVSAPSLSPARRTLPVPRPGTPSPIRR